MQIDDCWAPGCFQVRTSRPSAPQCEHLPTLIDGESDQKRTPVSSPLVPIFSTAERTSSAGRTCGVCTSARLHVWVLVAQDAQDAQDRGDHQTGLRPVHAVPATGEGVTDGIDKIIACSVGGRLGTSSTSSLKMSLQWLGCSDLEILAGNSEALSTGRSVAGSEPPRGRTAA